MTSAVIIKTALIHVLLFSVWVLARFLPRVVSGSFFHLFGIDLKGNTDSCNMVYRVQNLS